MDIALGFFVGIVAGCILIAIILKITKTDGSIKCNYDERQQLVRGKGFKYGFFTLIICNFLALGLSSFTKKQYIESEVFMIISILIGVFVYAVYCIWNDAYFSLNESPKKVLIAFALIALLNIGLGYRNYLRGILFQNGVLTIHCTNLFCGVLFLLIFLVLAIKHIYQKAEHLS